MKFKHYTYTPTPADFDMLVETERPHPAGGTRIVSQAMHMHGSFLLLSKRQQQADLRKTGKSMGFKVISYRLPDYGPKILMIRRIPIRKK